MGDDAPNNEDSEDDFSLTGFATHPIIQVNPIQIRSALELYHFIVINIVLLITFLKLIMLFEGLLFVRVIEGSNICTLDNLEIFPLTPRYLSVYTVSFFAFSDYIGKTSTDRTQYNFQKSCPFFIAGLHTIILVMRRRYLFTVDDVLISIMFMTSLSLFLALDYKKPLKSIATTENNKVKVTNAKVDKKPSINIDSVVDEYLESDLDGGEDS